MKKISILIATLLLVCVITGCSDKAEQSALVATTRPVYEFTDYLCRGTGITVTRLVTENVSCLHDYTLQTKQMRAAESAEAILISGAGLEIFLNDILDDTKTIIDCSQGISLLCEDAEHDHNDHTAHHHDQDPHIWLSPANAIIMVENIYGGLIAQYPERATIFANNKAGLIKELEALTSYAEAQLHNLSSRELVTFHDGFSYLADAFDLTILQAIEEESGSEASARELIEIIDLVNTHDLDAIFTETNGSTSASGIISAETGARLYALDMCMGERGYFDAMYYNIDTLKEALQ